MPPPHPPRALTCFMRLKIEKGVTCRGSRCPRLHPHHVDIKIAVLYKIGHYAARPRASVRVLREGLRALVHASMLRCRSIHPIPSPAWTTSVLGIISQSSGLAIAGLLLLHWPSASGGAPGPVAQQRATHRPRGRSCWQLEPIGSGIAGFDLPLAAQHWLGLPTQVGLPSGAGGQRLQRIWVF